MIIAIRLLRDSAGDFVRPLGSHGAEGSDDPAIVAGRPCSAWRRVRAPIETRHARTIRALKRLPIAIRRPFGERILEGRAVYADLQSVGGVFFLWLLGAGLAVDVA